MQHSFENIKDIYGPLYTEVNHLLSREPSCVVRISKWGEIKQGYCFLRLEKKFVGDMDKIQSIIGNYTDLIKKLEEDIKRICKRLPVNDKEYCVYSFPKESLMNYLIEGKDITPKIIKELMPMSDINKVSFVKEYYHDTSIEREKEQEVTSIPVIEKVFSELADKFTSLKSNKIVKEAQGNYGKFISKGEKLKEGLSVKIKKPWISWCWIMFIVTIRKSENL